MSYQLPQAKRRKTNHHQVAPDRTNQFCEGQQAKQTEQRKNDEMKMFVVLRYQTKRTTSHHQAQAQGSRQAVIAGAICQLAHSQSLVLVWKITHKT